MELLRNFLTGRVDVRLTSMRVIWERMLHHEGEWVRARWVVYGLGWVVGWACTGGPVGVAERSRFLRKGAAPIVGP